jgi:hypothetical protein
VTRQEQQTEHASLLSALYPAVQPGNMNEVVKRLSSEKVEEREGAECAFRALIARDLKALRCGRFCFHSVNLLFFGTIGLHRFYFTMPAMLGLVTVIALHQRAIGRRLAKLNTPQVVGPLLDVLATSSNLFRWSEIKRALIRLLPRLQATDVKWLTPDQRDYLLTLLRHDEGWPFYGRLWGADLKVAILKALEQVGDARAIPYVKHMSRSSKSEAVRIAAWDCLPALHANARRMPVEQSLLRASSPPASTETLLRPAASGIEVEPEQLLRPTSE